jgi:hypothetical protein
MGYRDIPHSLDKLVTHQDWVALRGNLSRHLLPEYRINAYGWIRSYHLPEDRTRPEECYIETKEGVFITLFDFSIIAE